MQIAIDGDLFKVILRFKKKAVSIQEEKPEQNNVLTGEGSTFPGSRCLIPYRIPRVIMAGQVRTITPPRRTFTVGIPECTEAPRECPAQEITAPGRKCPAPAMAPAGQ